MRRHLRTERLVLSNLIERLCGSIGSLQDRHGHKSYDCNRCTAEVHSAPLQAFTAPNINSNARTGSLGLFLSFVRRRTDTRMGQKLAHLFDQIT